MEAADVVAEVLHVHVIRRQQEVDAALRVDREGARRGGDGGLDDRLDGEAREGLPVGAAAVALLGADADAAGDVGAGLVGVEGHGAPPGGHGGGLRGGGGDGGDEVADDALLGCAPHAVPDWVDGDVGGEDWAHVVFQLHEFRRPLVFLRVAVEGGGGGIRFGFGPWPPREDGGGGEEDEEEEG